MNNSGMMLYIIVKNDIFAVTSHIDEGADYFTMCTILSGGTAVTDKDGNRKLSTTVGNFYRSCTWLDQKIYEAWFNVGKGYSTKGYSADHFVAVAMRRRLCINDIVFPGRKTVRSRHTSVMTWSLL